MSIVIGVAQVVIAAIGIVAALAIYRWQRQRKGLGVAVLTDRALLTTPSPFAVSLHHDGKVVDEPRLVVLRIANTGNVPVEKADFEQPLSIAFLYAEVLSAEVTGVDPSDLTPDLRMDGRRVVLAPCLLNPTDLIEIQCLLNGTIDDLHVECRVVGVRSVQKVKLSRDSWGRVWRVSKGDIVMMGLGPLICIGAAVGLFIGGGNVVLGSAILIGGVLWSWWGLRTIRRSRLWLALPPPKGH